MNKYLITGFSGFVGQYFVEYLESNEKNCLVKGLDIQNPDFRFDHYKNVKISFEKIDLLSKDNVEYIIYEFQPNFILHLASYSSVAFSWKEPVQSFQNNTNIFLNLIDAVRKLNIDTRVLSIGSSEEYGNVNDEDLPLKEDHKLNPVSPYAIARLSQEYLSGVYMDGYGMDIVLTRSFNHMGPMQKTVFVVSSLAKQLVEIKKSGKNKGDVVTGNVSIVRDFTDVRDVVHAYYLLLKEGKKGHIYNVCSGIGLSIKDLIDIIAKQLNIEVNIIVDNRLIRPTDNKKIIGSNEKIKREVGWENIISLEQSLKDIIIYWEENSNIGSGIGPSENEGKN
ncbi:MAG: GDP-mannose 4,6-dehydratase [Syntrophales bacterium]|jgi:GDP-4-dehydro-6-deoxy-D-mannose reductase